MNPSPWLILFSYYAKKCNNMPIPTTPFGATTLHLPRLALGLAALGRPGYINLGHAQDLAANYDVAAMEQRTHEMLSLAFKQGVRYFDAARSYGKAEDFLLSWLEKNPEKAAEVTVGSKWGYTYTAGWQVEAEKHEVKEHSLPVLERQWALSKRLLPYLKLYQIHSATFSSGVLDNTEVLTRLSALKAEGVAIGLSLSGPDQKEVLAKAMVIEIDGRRLFDAVQATFNVLEPSAGPRLQEAASSGMGVLIKEALANGRLTARNQTEAFAPKRRVLEGLADKYGVGIDAIALAYVLHFPWAHLVLSGAARAEHLLSNLQASDIQLSGEEVEELNRLAMPAEAYWEERSGMAWN